MGYSDSKLVETVRHNISWIEYASEASLDLPFVKEAILSKPGDKRVEDVYFGYLERDIDPDMAIRRLNEWGITGKLRYYIIQLVATWGGNYRLTKRLLDDLLLTELNEGNTVYDERYVAELEELRYISELNGYPALDKLIALLRERRASL